MRTFAIGDIHGAHKALVQCLERSGFNKKEDKLITLGDICDGWDEVYECVEELLTIENRIDILGNHDEWFHRFLDTTRHPDMWSQGGHGTLRAYARGVGKESSIECQVRFNGGLPIKIYLSSLLPEDIPDTHRQFFEGQVLYYKDDQRNMAFVHGGFDRYKSLRDNMRDHPYVLYWDRKLWEKALCCKGVRLATVDQFSRIFIGHTAIGRLRNERPVYSGGVMNLDTGAGWDGKLTIMEVDALRYWQSDNVLKLYPNSVGR